MQWSDEYQRYCSFRSGATRSPFITCFSLKELPLYQRAIAEYAKVVPEHDLEISFDGSWNYRNDPALLLHDRRKDLSEFWKIFYRCRAELESPL